MLLAAIITLYIASVSSLKTEEEECKLCIKVNTRCYNVSHLFDLEAPFRSKVVIPKMAILRSKNILFYSFEPNIADEEYYKVAFVNLDKPESIGLLSAGKKSVFNFGTFDIDQDNDMVYLGGSDGVFVLDTKINELRPYSSRGDIITSLNYKGNVYFVRYGENKIIQKKGDYFYPLLEYEPVKNFVINRNNVIVFLSTYGLFASKDGEYVLLSKNSYFRGITIDLDGIVYAWWIDGIYKVVLEDNLVDSTVVKVAHIPTVGAVVFDNENNIMFTLNKALYKLIGTNTTRC